MKCKLKPQWDTTTHPSEWQKVKKKTDNTKCCQRCGTTGTLLQCCGGCKTAHLAQPQHTIPQFYPRGSTAQVYKRLVEECPGQLYI